MRTPERGRGATRGLGKHSNKVFVRVPEYLWQGSHRRPWLLGFPRDCHGQQGVSTFGSWQKMHVRSSKFGVVSALENQRAML